MTLEVPGVTMRGHIMPVHKRYLLSGKQRGTLYNLISTELIKMLFPLFSAGRQKTHQS